VVVVVVVTMVVTPLHSGTPPVKTGRKGMQAGEISGDMGLTLGRLLQCSQQVRLKPFGGWTAKWCGNLHL
jgi:hypothetical protein